MSHPILDSTLHDLLEADFAASPVAASGFGLTEYDEKLDDLSADAFHQRDADAGAIPRQARADRGHRARRAAPDHRRRHRPRPRERRPARPPDPRAVRGLEARSRHVLGPGDQRAVRAVPPAAAAGARPRRRGDRAARPGRAGRRGGHREPRPGAGPPADRRARHAARRAAASGTSATSLWRTSRTRRARRTLRKAGAAAARRISTAGSTHLDEPSAARAHGTWQLGEDRYSRILQEREVLGDDARALRARGQAEFDRLDAEMTRARPGRGGQSRLRRGPPRGRAAPPADRAGDARDVHRVDGEGARVPRRDRASSRCPPGESCEVVPSPVFQRPILGVASYIAPPAFSRPLEGPLLRPVRARRRLGGGDPVAARRTTRTARSRRRRSTRRTRAITGTW